MTHTANKIQKITRINRLSFLVKTTTIGTKDEENKLKNQLKDYLKAQFKHYSSIFSLTLHQNSREASQKIGQWPNSILSEYEIQDFDVIFLFLGAESRSIPDERLLTNYNIKNLSTIFVFICQKPETNKLAA